MFYGPHISDTMQIGRNKWIVTYLYSDSGTYKELTVCATNEKAARVTALLTLARPIWT